MDAEVVDVIGPILDIVQGLGQDRRKAEPREPANEYEIGALRNQLAQVTARLDKLSRRGMKQSPQVGHRRSDRAGPRPQTGTADACDVPKAAVLQAPPGPADWLASHNLGR